MSIELLGLVVAVIAAALAAAQLWQGRRRRHNASDLTAAQALREEAVAALTDTAWALDHVVGMSFHGDVRDALTEHLEAVLEECRKLVKLRSRLRVARGIDEEEVEAFTTVIDAVASTGDALHALLERQLQHPTDGGLPPGSEDELDILRRGLERFGLAQHSFETTVNRAKDR